MKLLASIHPEDVDSEAPQSDYATFSERQAGRVIIFNGDKICLIHVSAHDYYMLPGGGIEDEDIPSALAREIMEEAGCEATVKEEVGSIEVYFDRWQQKQVDFCYTAQKVGIDQEISASDFEKSEGHEVVWADDLAAAIKLVKDADPKERDGKMVKARDLIFLKTLAAKLGSARTI
jgi:8-oxo-dGTP pyrophosphatase MutT (NUDIX family)